MNILAFAQLLFHWDNKAYTRLLKVQHLATLSKPPAQYILTDMACVDTYIGSLPQSTQPLLPTTLMQEPFLNRKSHHLAI